MMLKVLLYVILLQTWATSTFVPIHGHRSARVANHGHPKDQLKNFKITDVENTYVTIGKTHNHIKEFRVSEKYIVDCFKHELKIVFIIENDGKMNEVYAFLRNEMYKGNYVSITEMQKSEICQPVKRLN